MFDFLQKKITLTSTYSLMLSKENKNNSIILNELKLEIAQQNLKDDTKQRFVNVIAYNFDPLYRHQMLMGFLFILIRVFENISNIKNMFNKSVIHNIQIFFPESMCDSKTPNEECIQVAKLQNKNKNKNSLFSITSLKNKIKFLSLFSLSFLPYIDANFKINNLIKPFKQLTNINMNDPKFSKPNYMFYQLSSAV